MPKCDRCGSTENVQRSLVVDMPAKCLKCMDAERDEAFRVLGEDISRTDGLTMWG